MALAAWGPVAEGRKARQKVRPLLCQIFLFGYVACFDCAQILGELKPRWLYGRTTRVRKHPHICTRLGYRCYAYAPVGSGRKLRNVTKTLRC